MTTDTLGLEPGPAGHAVGRDPRAMTQEELRDMGHEPRPATKAIRLKCLDCCVGQANEVRQCVATDCALWPWRMGNHPWRAGGRGGPASDHAVPAEKTARGALPAANSDHPATLLPGHEAA